ncbi:MAG: hypothetical protein ACLGXA_07170 [Acidobacteriota bacterium]
MRAFSLYSFFLVATFAATAGLPVQAQTDVAISGFGSITQTATGKGITESTPAGYGGMIEVRYIQSSLRGVEVAYSMSDPRSRELSSSGPLSPSGFPCGQCSIVVPPTSIDAYEQILSADWVPSMKAGNLRPFGVLGVGLMIGTPAIGQVTAQIPAGNGGGAVFSPFSLTVQMTPAYVYGAGFDWALGSRFGLRLQYRGQMYKAPNLAPTLYPNTNSFIQSAQPSLGFYFHL